MQSLRSSQPFFQQPDTQRVIQRIAASLDLVIFVGAGVTVDQTGITLQGLVTALLERKSGSARKEIILKTQATESAASIAAELYVTNHGAQWKEQLANDLRSNLYEKDTWEAGPLAMNLVRLAGNIAQRGGRVRFVTTNYDTHLEEMIFAYNDSIRDRPDDQMSSRILLIDKEFARTGSGSGKGRGDQPKEIEITYLHGRIDRKRGSDGGLVLREADYFATAADKVDARLVELLTQTEQSVTLIVGSGLTDTPLLRALAKTARAGGPRDVNEQKRFAVYPLQSKDTSALDELMIDELKRAMELRMRQFDTKLIIPNFYFQVAQFLEELITCSALGSTPSVRPAMRYVGDGSQIRYDARLLDWWTKWSSRRLRRISEAQNVAQPALQNVVEKLSETYSFYDECIRLELWVRWDPAQAARELRLWALSTGTQLDIRALRAAKLDGSSHYASVRAFCGGRPTLEDRFRREGILPSSSDKWMTVLAVPVSYDHEYGLLPVGVVTLMSQTELSNSRLSTLDVAELRAVVELLREVGRDLVGPASFR
jgi:SIR2-like domain